MINSFNNLEFTAATAIAIGEIFAEKQNKQNKKKLQSLIDDLNSEKEENTKLKNKLNVERNKYNLNSESGIISIATV